MGSVMEILTSLNACACTSHTINTYLDSTMGLTVTSPCNDQLCQTLYM